MKSISIGSQFDYVVERLKSIPDGYPVWLNCSSKDLTGLVLFQRILLIDGHGNSYPAFVLGMALTSNTISVYPMLCVGRGVKYDS